jgi:hypothetical protein
MHPSIGGWGGGYLNRSKVVRAVPPHISCKQRPWSTVVPDKYHNIIILILKLNNTIYIQIGVDIGGTQGKLNTND